MKPVFDYAVGEKVFDDSGNTGEVIRKEKFGNTMIYDVKFSDSTKSRTVHELHRV